MKKSTTFKILFITGAVVISSFAASTHAKGFRDTSHHRYNKGIDYITKNL